MHSVAVVFVLLGALCVFTRNAQAAKQLRFVQAIWRHGDRAPGALPYPNDRHTEDHWPRGWNQLTNEGMRQLKDLGQFMRQRYAGTFVNPTYNAKEVVVVSSDKPRALVSAQSLLYGFFPPSAHEKFDNAINWHPIPVHSNGFNVEDPLLKPTKFACPTYERLVVKEQEKYAKRIFAQFADLFRFVRNATGFERIGLEELKSLGELNKELEHSMPQPSWVMRTWPKHSNKTTVALLTELALHERLSRLERPALAHLRGGYLLGDWLQRAHSIAKGKKIKPRKMLLYSSHDGTLQSFLHVLEVANGIQIPYAGCVIMEIYENDGHYTAKLLFRHGTELSPLAVKGCGEECSVEMFISVLKKRAIFTLEKLHKECGRSYCDNSLPEQDDTPNDHHNTKRNNKSKKLN